MLVKIYVWARVRLNNNMSAFIFAAAFTLAHSRARNTAGPVTAMSFQTQNAQNSHLAIRNNSLCHLKRCKRQQWICVIFYQFVIDIFSLVCFGLVRVQFMKKKKNQKHIWTKVLNIWYTTITFAIILLLKTKNIHNVLKYAVQIQQLNKHYKIAHSTIT